MKLSQNLSSSCLFHFTGQLEYLTSILKDGFQARYCTEKLPKAKVAYLAPMVCFCDIPLGAVKFHLSRYGGYGIGLKKSALRDVGVTPLFYIHAKSPQFPITGSPRNIEELKALSITPYLKPTFGSDPVFEEGTRKVIRTRQVNYMNEKEWRYVPRHADIDVFKYKTNQELVDLKDNHNGNGSFHKLEIKNLDQIEYIILGRNEDITPFLKFVDELDELYTFDRELLISKILTQGQILRDF